MPRCPGRSSHGSCSTGGQLSRRCDPLTMVLAGEGTCPGKPCDAGQHAASDGHAEPRLMMETLRVAMAGQVGVTRTYSAHAVLHNSQLMALSSRRTHLHCLAVLSHHTAMSMPSSLTWQGRAGSKSSSTATGYHDLYQSNCSLVCCCCSPASTAGVTVCFCEPAAAWLSCW